jgi:hypothetical protein
MEGNGGVLEEWIVLGADGERAAHDEDVARVEGQIGAREREMALYDEEVEAWWAHVHDHRLAGGNEDGIPLRR